MTRSRRTGMIAAGVITAVIGLSLTGQRMALASTTTVTNCNASGAGSLSDAVANAAAGDTITFNLSPSCGLITLTSTLTITQNLTITGPGAANMAVSGGNTVGVFSIGSGAQVGISGLTIENGNSGNGGGITNSGGGIVTLTDSTVSNNNGTGGGIYTTGAGSSVTLNGSTVSDNTGGNAGGIDSNAGSALTLNDSTVSDNNGNITSGDTGGIASLPMGSGAGVGPGPVTLTDSTVSGNTGEGSPGGINNQGSMTLTDSTVYNNTATFAGDGGIGTAGTLTLTDSTVSGNTGSDGGAGGITNYAGTVNVGATIVAGNTGGNCSGPLASAGYNLSDDGSCGFNPPGDLVNTNPQLGPLADNGGPTQTMVPQTGSPAINVIPPGTTLNGVQVCPRTDQRGVPSATGGNCTIGAVEIPTPPAATTIAVMASGSETYGGGNLTFSQTNNAPAGVTLSGTVTCTTAGNVPLGSLGVGSSPYTLDGSSCSGLSASGPGSYQISYQGAANGFTVHPATPQVTWATPAPIPWGTPLSAAQLNATASVPGTFAYTPPAGTLLGPGNNQALSASFTPTDTADYTNATASVTVNVVFNPAACITGKVTGPLVIAAGEAYCVRAGAVISNGVTIKPGGALDMTGGTIKGSLTATGATAITVCGANVTGSVTITGSSSPLNIGTCGKNTIAGSVSITSNTGGLTYTGNTVAGSLTITGNTGTVQILPPNPTSGKVTITGNT